jgi:hypothetical protein
VRPTGVSISAAKNYTLPLVQLPPLPRYSCVPHKVWEPPLEPTDLPSGRLLRSLKPSIDLLQLPTFFLSLSSSTFSSPRNCILPTHSAISVIPIANIGFFRSIEIRSGRENYSVFVIISSFGEKTIHKLHNIRLGKKIHHVGQKCTGQWQEEGIARSKLDW